MVDNTSNQPNCSAIVSSTLNHIQRDILGLRIQTLDWFRTRSTPYVTLPWGIWATLGTGDEHKVTNGKVGETWKDLGVSDSRPQMI